jgi:hypothetical protein
MTTGTIAAIPTFYDGRMYRSRLEARWAAFFGAVGWPFEYEPLELEGYIPDFVLLFDKPVLVEVKPALVITDLEQYAAKIERTSWDGEALIVGARLFDSESFITGPAIGILAERMKWVDGDMEFGCDGEFSWASASGILCGICRRLSFIHDVQSYR